MDWDNQRKDQERVDQAERNPTVFIDSVIGDGDMTPEQAAYVEAWQAALQATVEEAWNKVKAEQKDLQNDANADS